MTAERSTYPQFVRAFARSGKRLNFSFDGIAMSGFEGETVLTALLCAGHRVRTFEFADADRAGFCVMAACQDCWVWVEGGGRLRACSAPLEEGMRLLPAPKLPWSIGDA